jgi:predicted nucleic acid-binding protein
VSTFAADASVVGKWLLPGESEPLREQAMQWLRRYGKGELRFIVPDLIGSELADILWKSVRQRRFTNTAAKSALQSLQTLQIPLFPR